MTATTITNFRKNLFGYVSNAIRYNDPVQVTTKEGNAVLLSEEEYNGMLATLELMSVPGMVERINAAANEPDSEFVDAEAIGW
ncbi:MAG: type II toxin-antitoxin system Phd/YefM family antitoxin [Clostridia bacterium]|nr:type II toxin-antitoxin system Phd/YefM family antitoxin [Clostridia bacterium]